MPPLELCLSTTGTVFDIERYAVHDGPGIRSLVFFKGCPLRCLWCSNPEGQSGKRQIGYASGNCIGCHRCLGACGAGALSVSGRGIVIDREKCILCGACVSVCPPAALTITGEVRTVASITSVIKRDMAFYRRSGGGVTISGGEPLAQPTFLEALLAALKADCIGTAIETSGLCGEKVLRKVLPLIDLVLFDIKHMDDARHREGTGESNAIILQNARIAASSGTRMVVRVPVIPGYNDSADNIRETAEFARALGVKSIHLLPYHRLGLPKYVKLGMEYRLPDVVPPSRDLLANLRDIVVSTGLTCGIGGG